MKLARLISDKAVNLSTQMYLINFEWLSVNFHWTCSDLLMQLKNKPLGLVRSNTRTSRMTSYYLRKKKLLLSTFGIWLAA